MAKILIHRSPSSRSRKWWFTALVIALAAPCLVDAEDKVEWPEPTQTSKPWTRWWWHGSAVDAENITRLLEEYQRAGLGGVEITCIYAVKDNAARNLPYRSEKWVEAIRHSVEEAKRLGMGVDLPPGSGWRMGGPTLPREFGNTELVIKQEAITGPSTFNLELDKMTPEAAIAVASDGAKVDLTGQIDGDQLAWEAPEGEWQVVVAGRRQNRERVKRPAPGGEGLDINPFWKESVMAFLDDFGSSMEQVPGIRSQFHDSFEYDGNWRPGFFDEFAKRRDYRLEEHLHELAGVGEPDRIARVKADYRETLSDLVLDDFITPWVEWSHAHGMLARNQSHGSPANWLDLYASCDIPETESFGRMVGGDADSLVLKFAASAANVAGRRLVSAESVTWLDEHFTVTLAQMKQMIDRQVLSGVNHVFYHGTVYSPDDAAWPGWLFYASTQVNPLNPWWRDLPVLNRYVTRCQSLLQASRPDNDVLLYWPIHDAWHSPDGLRMEVRVHNSGRWFDGHPIGEAAEFMHEHGFTFDYVSDRLLWRCRASESGVISAPGGEYSAVVVPDAEHLPLETLYKLIELADSGCEVILWKGVPESLPGLKGADNAPRWADQRRAFTNAVGKLKESASLGDDLQMLLAAAGVQGESWTADSPLAFERRQTEQGVLYFIVNQSDSGFEGSITPAAEGSHAVLMAPMSGDIGSAERLSDGSLRLQLEPHASVFLRLANTPAGTPAWKYREAAGEANALAGEWTVEFIAGGPESPDAYTSTGGPEPWTERGDESSDAFAGTARYTCHFDRPGDAETWLLDLGETHTSARVRLNGDPVADLIGPSYSCVVDTLRAQDNVLEVDVTGVAANRIRDLDRRGVEWQIFEDINFVNIDYRPFDASDWPVRPMGLQGPVTLTPLK